MTLAGGGPCAVRRRGRSPLDPFTHGDLDQVDCDEDRDGGLVEVVHRLTGDGFLFDQTKETIRAERRQQWIFFALGVAVSIPVGIMINILVP
ncbi:hypothetical protein [Nonomuraea antimicrobica]|uniref:hypothetical protein n=1 Tax=Nonomuraea antimicrobica TaxID=561173 RepID=UPI0031E85060